MCIAVQVAHRLDAVMACDEVVVMSAGEVIEQGQPQALLSNPSSTFAAMSRLQMPA